jgi:hypothetical protein
MQCLYVKTKSSWRCYLEYKVKKYWHSTLTHKERGPGSKTKTNGNNIRKNKLTDSVPDAVAASGREHRGGSMHYGPDEHSRRNRPWVTQYRTQVMLVDSLGIYGPNVWVLSKDVCEQNHAECSQCCVPHSWACFQAKHCWGKQAVHGKHRSKKQ